MNDEENILKMLAIAIEQKSVLFGKQRANAADTALFNTMEKANSDWRTAGEEMNRVIGEFSATYRESVRLSSEQRMRKLLVNEIVNLAFFSIETKESESR